MPSRRAKLDALIQSFDLAEVLFYEERPYEAGKLRRWEDHEHGVEVLAYETAPYDEANPELTFGAKRNAVLRAAKGEYVVTADDDDRLHPRFLELVLAAIEQKPDVIGYKVACYGYAQTNGEFDPSIMEPADVSIKYDGWYNNRNGFKYVRCPHHIVPVRAEHVRAIGFKPMHHGEDHEYSIRMRDSGRLKTEVYIDEFMYVYLFNAKKQKGE
jgi:glycosyltransferase involved in cell wall biosynthesis